MEQIKIPSILIQKEDAENIKQVLNDTNEHTLSLAIHFPLVKSNDVGNIRMILQVDDFRSYDSILALSRFKEIFQELMELTIHYKVFKNVDVPFTTENCVKDDIDTYCVV